ncbi:hypothetical protein [Rivularia sp. PCC 7116]|nr:hypothetical protein [Rivularia sp. PCC 7116]
MLSQQLIKIATSAVEMPSYTASATECFLIPKAFLSDLFCLKPEVLG